MGIGDKSKETSPLGPPRGGAGACLCLLGPLQIRRGGVELQLPRSRKVRALLGYLALAPRPVPRAKLCDLLWDVASDPRSELRWCLTKLRALIDEPGQPRLVSDREWVAIDASDLDVDATRYARLIEPALQGSCPDALRLLVGMVAGDVLEELRLDRAPLFETWLAGERHRFADWHGRALARLAQLVPAGSAEALDLLRRRLALTPHVPQAHIDLLTALAARGLKADAERHLAQAVRMLEGEGLDPAPLQRAWSAAQSIAISASAQPAADAVAAPVVPVPVHPPKAAVDQHPLLRRASIAVMPFAVTSPADQGFADGLAHDIIIGLARLRSLMVIARGTAFALRDRNLSPREAGELLGVTYVASGVVHRQGQHLRIGIELIACATGQIVWVEEFASPAAQVLELLGTLAARIVTGIDAEIHTAERNRAILRVPNSLDAWGAYHRGLWSMFRFKAADNDEAQVYLRQAIARDPTFSRAHAALSFTHFQNAFLLKGTAERGRETDWAFEAAGQSLMADRLDPAAHWAMGRALWLRGDDTGSVRSLDEAVRLSPSFAMGHYTVAFVHSQTGDPRKAVAAADTSRQLSPYDPLLFAICAAKSFALMRLGQAEGAADGAREAAQQPNAHVHVQAVAALTAAAAGRLDEAGSLLGGVRRERPDYDMKTFLSAFRLDGGLEAQLRRAAQKLGLD